MLHGGKRRGWQARNTFGAVPLKPALRILREVPANCPVVKRRPDHPHSGEKREIAATQRSFARAESH